MQIEEEEEIKMGYPAGLSVIRCLKTNKTKKIKTGAVSPEICAGSYSPVFRENQGRSSPCSAWLIKFPSAARNTMPACWRPGQ